MLSDRQRIPKPYARIANIIPMMRANKSWTVYSQNVTLYCHARAWVGVGNFSKKKIHVHTHTHNLDAPDTQRLERQEQLQL